MNRYCYCLINPLKYTSPSGEFWQYIVAAAFFYLKSAHDYRDPETGKWDWKPFGKGSTFVAGVNTNTEFSDVTGYIAGGSGYHIPSLSYNNNYGPGFGYWSPQGSSFTYPGVNHNRASEVVLREMSEVRQSHGAAWHGSLGGGPGWGPFAGTAGTIAGEMFYSKTYGTWMGKNFKMYQQTWGGNRFTGGKNKFGKTTSNVIKWGGRSLGAWNAFSIQRNYAAGEMGTGWMLAEQGTNAFSTLGGIYGAAWGVGWELGRGVTNMGWYQEAKFNFWYNRWENQVGAPSQSNEALWYYFYQNYKP